MDTLRKTLFSWLLLPAPLLVAATACEDDAPVAETPVVVQAAAPTVRDVDVTLTYPFEIEADRSVSITPVGIHGFLTKVPVDVGDQVEAGQLIALIDCREYTAQRTQAETAIEKREARAVESRSQLDRLTRMGDRLVSPVEIERAQAEARIAEAELADARAKLSEAQQRKGYCSLRAPFDGFVSERFLDPGAMVSPGGLPVVNLVKTREVRGVASVMESDAPKVLRGASVDVTLNAFPETTFQAKVARFGRTLDPKTRTMRVEMDLPNAQEVLLPGMTGTADIVIGVQAKAKLVPITALLQLEDVVYAYVVDDGDGRPRARRVEVELGVDLGDWIEIREGVEADDQVIVVGRELVDDGTLVEVRPPRDEEASTPETLGDEGAGAGTGGGGVDTEGYDPELASTDSGTDGADTDDGGETDGAMVQAAAGSTGGDEEAEPEQPAPRKKIESPEDETSADEAVGASKGAKKSKKSKKANPSASSKSSASKSSKSDTDSNESARRAKANPPTPAEGAGEGSNEADGAAP